MQNFENANKTNELRKYLKCDEIQTYQKNNLRKSITNFVFPANPFYHSNYIKLLLLSFSKINQKMLYCKEKLLRNCQKIKLF